EFSEWERYPTTVRIRRRHPPQSGPPDGPQPAAAASANIAGPSNLQRTDNHGRNDRYQSSGEGMEQSGESPNQASEEDWVQQSDKDPYQSSGDEAGQSDDEQGAEQELVVLDPEIEGFRRKMNSSIVVGAKVILSPGQKLARIRMFDLEMSEANGGMIFDYEFLEQFILGDMDHEIVAAEPTSELEGRFLIFREVRFNRRQREFYKAVETRLNEVGGAHLRPRAVRRGGADTVRRMILLSLKACCHLDFVLMAPGGIGYRHDAVGGCDICQARMHPRSTSRFCPLCHEQVIRFRPTGTPRELNPKIEEMIRILRETASDPQRRSGKSIIICQFRDFANLIAERLGQNEFRFVEFHDSNEYEKLEAMGRIEGERRIKVALATVNPADIHGFDFRPFDTVILMDLWWDPGLDARAFRINHGVDVDIYELYFENTVEGRVLELLNQPQPIGDGNQDLIHQLGIYSTPDNLDALLQPT
ncbi:hypothetical protein FRC01_013213, partial [Tulasnella sp. 417]